MSFQAMTWAVKQNTCGPSSKLVLIMLANRTNPDDGRCFPSHKILAEECNMSVSCLKEHIKKLELSGFLTIERRSIENVSLSNQYTLNLDFIGSENQPMPVEIKPTVGQNLTGGGSESGYINIKIKQKEETKESITNVIDKKVAKERRKDETQYDKIVELYHEHLPQLSQISKLTDKRKSAIRRLCEDLEDLNEWTNYFKFIGKSKFLIGKVEPVNGRTKPFKADFDFLINQNNFVKISEDKYHG